MKVREIIGAILMVVLTLSGVVLACISSLALVLDSENIIYIMDKTNYIEKVEQEERSILLNYLPKEKVDELLDNVSVTSNIIKMVKTFETNNITEVSNEIKENFKNRLINVLDEDIANDTKSSFATTVSNAYIKAIFPITEFGLLSSIYVKYNTVLTYAIATLTVLVLGIYIYLALGKKTYKWAIIALYNVIIFSLIITFVMATFNNIFIGNERVTALVLGVITNIRNNILIAVLIILLIAIFSNYMAYFRKRRHSKK